MISRASAHIYQNGSVLKDFISSRNVESAARFGVIVREPLKIWGYVKCGVGLQQPRVCVLHTVMDFSDPRFLLTGCWEQSRQCGSVSIVSDGEEPVYEKEQDTHIERERERDRHKRNVIFQKATVTNDNQP